MNQADSKSLGGGETLAREHVFARSPGTDSGYDPWGNDGGNIAQTDLGEPERGRYYGERNLDGCDKARPASERGAVNAGNYRLRKQRDCGKHIRMCLASAKFSSYVKSIIRRIQFRSAPAESDY